MSKSLKKLIDINRLREFKNKLVGTDSAYVQTAAVDQTIAGTKTFSNPIAGSVTGSSGSCTGNAATATTATTAEACTGNAATATRANSAASADTATNATYTNWLRTSSHSDHLFHTEWDGVYFWTYVTAGDGGYRAVRVARSDSAMTAEACTGNAATATKATQDSDGNQINTTYSKNGHTHDDRYYTEAEVNNLLAGKANTSHTHNSVRTLDNNNNISFDWSSQASGFVGLTVDSIKQGGIVTTITLGEIGVYGIGSTVLAITGTWIDYGEITAGSGLKYAALDRNGGIYDLDTGIGATGTWVKVSGNSGGTGGFGLYRRIA